jgi:hypothetical protein
MIAAVRDGRWSGYEAAANACVSMLHQYDPNPTERSERKYRRFCALYEAALQIGRI